MLKNSENNGTEEIGLVTPTPGLIACPNWYGGLIDKSIIKWIWRFNSGRKLFYTHLLYGTNRYTTYLRALRKSDISLKDLLLFFNHFYPAALKGSGVLSYPERAGGRQGRQAPLTLSRP